MLSLDPGADSDGQGTYQHEGGFYILGHTQSKSLFNIPSERDLRPAISFCWQTNIWNLNLRSWGRGGRVYSNGHLPRPGGTHLMLMAFGTCEGLGRLKERSVAANKPWMALGDLWCSDCQEHYGNVSERRVNTDEPIYKTYDIYLFSTYKV